MSETIHAASHRTPPPPTGDRAPERPAVEPGDTEVVAVARRLVGPASVTLVWYALPDLVRARGPRAVPKAGIVVGLLGMRLAVLRDESGGRACRAPEMASPVPTLAAPAPAPTRQVGDDTAAPVAAEDHVAGEDRHGPTDGREGPTTPDGVVDPSPETCHEDAAPGILLAVSVPLVALGLTTWLSARGESWLFRRAERRRAEGHRLPHLRQALVLATLAALGASLPDTPAWAEGTREHPEGSTDGLTPPTPAV